MDILYIFEYRDVFLEENFKKYYTNDCINFSMNLSIINF